MSQIKVCSAGSTRNFMIHNVGSYYSKMCSSFTGHVQDTQCMLGTIQADRTSSHISSLFIPVHPAAQPSASIVWKIPWYCTQAPNHPHSLVDPSPSKSPKLWHRQRRITDHHPLPQRQPWLPLSLSTSSLPRISTPVVSCPPNLRSKGSAAVCKE